MKTFFFLLFLLSSTSFFGQEEDCCYCPKHILKDPLRDPQTWEKLVSKPTDRQLWERYVNKPETEWTKEIQDSVRKWKQIFMIRRVYDMDNFRGFNPNFEPYYENGVVIKDWDFERIIESKGDTAILNKIIVQNPENSLHLYIFMPKLKEADFEALKRYFLALHRVFGLKYLPYNPKTLKKDWISIQEEQLKMVEKKQQLKLVELLKIWRD